MAYELLHLKFYMGFIKRLFIIFFIFILASSSSSLGKVFRTAYIGISGPGNGLGFMGHIFLLFTERPDQFLTSIAYQYTVRVPDNFEFKITEVAQISSFPFIVTKSPGWGFLKSYNKEGRYIHLFKLKFTEEETQRMKKNVEADMELRESSKHFDYSAFSNNCATKIYDHVNVIAGWHVITYSSLVSATFTLSFIRPRTIAITVPLSASINLGNNPIISGTTKFRSEDMLEFENNLLGAIELESLSNLCGLAPETFQAILRAFGNKELRETPSYLDMIQNLFIECLHGNPSALIQYNFHLQFIWYMSQSSDFRDLVSKYYK